MCYFFLDTLQSPLAWTNQRRVAGREIKLGILWKIPIMKNPCLCVKLESSDPNERKSYPSATDRRASEQNRPSFDRVIMVANFRSSGPRKNMAIFDTDWRKFRREFVIGSLQNCRKWKRPVRFTQEAPTCSKYFSLRDHHWRVFQNWGGGGGN